MKCPQCGSECPDNALFCTECGTALPAAPADAPQQPSAPQPAETQTEPAGCPQPAATPQPADEVAQPAAASPQPESAPGQQPVPPAGQPQAPYGQPIYNQASSAPWYGKTWVIVLFLLFFWPVGIVLMWLKSCTWSKVVKVVVSVILGLCVVSYVFMVIAMFNAFSQASNDIARSDTTITAPSAPKSSLPDAGSNSKSAPDTSKGTPAPSTGTLDNSRLKDAKDNPTVYALINIDGSDLDGLLQSCGLKFDRQWQGWINDDMSRSVDLYDSNTDNVSFDTIKSLSSTELLASGDFFVTCGSSYDSLDSFASSVVNTDTQSVVFRSDDGSTRIYEVTDLDGNVYNALVSGVAGSYSFMITRG